MPNLNANFLQGGTWGAPATIGSVTPNTGAFTTLSATGQITSTVSTGTAPFVAASTTASSINVTTINGVTVTGVPTAGQIPVATSGTAAAWQSGSASTASAYNWTCYFSSNLAPGQILICQWNPVRSITLKQMTMILGTSSSGCGQGAVVSVYDSTSATILVSITTTNGQFTYDTGNALNVVTTAGHNLEIAVTTPSSGCGQNPANAQVLVAYN